jgi:hypothetical protein
MIVSSSTLQHFQYLLIGASGPCGQSGRGAYVLRSKGEGNRHRKKVEMKSKIGQGTVKMESDTKSLLLSTDHSR